MTTDTPAAAPITAEREAFETAWSETFAGSEDRRENYRSSSVEEIAWTMWQARAALSAPVAAQPAASGVEPSAVTLSAEDAHFVAVRLRRLCAHLNYTLPKFADDDASLINIAGTVIGALLTNLTHAAPASALTGAQPAPAAPSEFWTLLHEWADSPNEERRGWIEHRFAELFALAAPAAQPADSAMTDEQIDAIFHANHNPEESPWVNWRRFARALTAASKES